MNYKFKIYWLLLFMFVVLVVFCVSKKEYMAFQFELEIVNKDVACLGESFNDYMKCFFDCDWEKVNFKVCLQAVESNMVFREEQVNDLKDLVVDLCQ